MNAKLSPLLTLLLLAPSALASHRTDEPDEPIDAQDWHVHLLFYAPGLDLMLLVAYPSIAETTARVAAGEPAAPTVAAEHDLAPDDIVPETQAGAASAPGLAADAAAGEAWALALRAADLAHEEWPREDRFTCIVLCVVANGGSCPSGTTLPP